MNKVASQVGLQIGVVVTLGLLFGFAANSVFSLALVAAILMVPVLWWSIQYPPLVVTGFWMTYAVQTTVLGGATFSGLYYPVYGFLIANSLIRLITSKLRALSMRVWIPYVGFLSVVMLGLMWQPTGLAVATGQRFFIFTIGLLVALQLRSTDQIRVVLITMAVASAVASCWVITQAVGSGFAYRGGVVVNPNYVATIIDAGLTAAFAALLDTRQKLLPLSRLGVLFCLGIGAYANLILGSRGVAAALVMAVGSIMLRRIRDLRTAMAVVVLALVSAVVLVSLPGAQGLTSRFSEENTDTLNDRIPLWAEGIAQFAAAPAHEVAFGAGMGASEVIVRSVNPRLTSMHNGYLQILVDYGVIGLGLFLALAGVAWTQSRQGEVGVALNGLIVYWMATLLTATTADNFLFWVSLGCCLASVSAAVRVP